MNQPESHTEPAEPAQPMMRGFWSLIITQFEGAFNDNALKTLVTFIGLSMALSAGMHKSLISLTTALFALPFILLSMAGGFLADHFSKRTVTVSVKVLEVLIMAIATAGFALKNLPLGLAAIFLMGVHSAIFGPSKYGLLPELLPEKRLSWGNGILELGTWLAIILGMMAGAELFAAFPGRQAWSGAILVGLALLGLAFSLGITRVPAADSTRQFRANFLSDLWAQTKVMRADRVLWLACLGNIYFSFIAVLVQQGVIDYGADVLKVDPVHTTRLWAAVAVGIGLGTATTPASSREAWMRMPPRSKVPPTRLSGSLALATRPELPPTPAHPRGARVLWRFLHRAGYRHSPAPALQAAKRGDSGGG